MKGLVSLNHTGMNSKDPNEFYSINPSETLILNTHSTKANLKSNRSSERTYKMKIPSLNQTVLANRGDFILNLSQVAESGFQRKISNSRINNSNNERFNNSPYKQGFTKVTPKNINRLQLRDVSTKLEGMIKNILVKNDSLIEIPSKKEIII